MKLTLIARADNTGLGNQTWELFRHLKPNKTYVIDLNSINATMGKQTHLYTERFPGARIIDGFPKGVEIDEMLDDTDVVFSVEIPYNYYLFEAAKRRGVKTVLQYNFEFLDYLNQPGLPLPDLLLAPSPWRLGEVKQIPTAVEYMPVPTNRKLLPFKIRESANNFLHIAGHKTFEDRNGTEILLTALPMITQPVNIFIHTQSPEVAQQVQSVIDAGNYSRKVNLVLKDKEYKYYWDLFSNDYDVLILPRRYGGLSLQLNEALSVGMPVLMTDCEPQNAELPRGMLIPHQGSKKIMTRTEIDCYHPSPRALAASIDDFHKNPHLVRTLSQWANRHSMLTDWATMKEVYRERLEKLCQTTE